MAITVSRNSTIKPPTQIRAGIPITTVISGTIKTPLVKPVASATTTKTVQQQQSVPETLSRPLVTGGGGGGGGSSEDTTKSQETTTKDSTTPNPSDRNRMWLLVVASAIALGGIGYFTAKGMKWNMPLTIGGGVVLGAGVGYGISLMLPPTPVHKEQEHKMSDNAPMSITIIE